MSREAVAVALAFAAIALASALAQDPITLGDGKGLDGASYYQVAEQLARGERPAADAPFVYRVGTPALVALLFPGDLMRGFRWINACALAFATALLVLWLRLQLRDWRVRFLLVLLFLAHWKGPLRFAFFYPTLVDPALYVFLLLGLLAMDRLGFSGKGIAALAAISAIGVAFREVVLVLPLALLFRGLRFDPSTRELWLRAKPGLLLRSVPLIAGALVFAAIHALATPLGPYSFVRAAGFWVHQKSLPVYLHAWFISFGPILILALWGFRESARLFRDQPQLAAYLAAFALLAFIGGNETERILLWATPVVWTCIGRAIESGGPALRSVPLVATLGLAQCLSMRVFWTIPDFPGNPTPRFPLLTALGSDVSHSDLLSSLAPGWVQLASLAEYLALSAAIGLWLAYRGGWRIRLQPPADPGIAALGPEARGDRSGRGQRDVLHAVELVGIERGADDGNHDAAG